MEHQELRSHDVLKITPERLGKLRDFSTVIAFMISIIIMVSFKMAKVENPDGSFNFEATIDYYPQLMMTYLGYVQLCTSFALLVGFCMNRINIILKSGWRRKKANG